VFDVILNALKSDPHRVKGGIPFFFLPLRVRRNHNGLACQDTYEDILLQANQGQPAGCGVQETFGEPIGGVLLCAGAFWASRRSARISAWHRAVFSPARPTTTGGIEVWGRDDAHVTL
jgi:hypothetical protein